MINIKNVEAYLTALIDVENDSIAVAWEKFKTFSFIPVEGEESREILFESGIFDFTGLHRFHYNFVRQFSLDRGMYQLHCEYIFENAKGLDYLEIAEWSMDYASLAEFFAIVEDMEAFKKGLHLKPIEFKIYLEEV